MKKTLCYAAVLVAITFSCTQEEVAVKNSSSTFQLKDVNGEVVQQLPSDLLPAIHDDLIKKGRRADAEKLYELYNLETGTLKGVTIKKESKAGRANDQYAPYDVFAYAHVQSYFDMGPFVQATSTTGHIPDNYAGMTGANKRLEAMTMQTNSTLETTRPTIRYALRLANLAYTTTGSWGIQVGNTGISEAKCGLKMWFENAPDFSIWYKAHNQSSGWGTSWVSNGQFAGNTNKRLEAFAFYIIQY